MIIITDIKVAGPSFLVSNHNLAETRMHSSRMRTGRSLTVCWSLLPGGVSAPGGCVSGPGGLSARGVSVPGGICSRGGGVCFQEGCLVRGGLLWGDVCSWGGVVYPIRH